MDWILFIIFKFFKPSFWKLKKTSSFITWLQMFSQQIHLLNRQYVLSAGTLIPLGKLPDALLFGSHLQGLHFGLNKISVFCIVIWLSQIHLLFKVMILKEKLVSLSGQSIEVLHEVGLVLLKIFYFHLLPLHLALYKAGRMVARLTSFDKLMNVHQNLLFVLQRIMDVSTLHANLVKVREHICARPIGVESGLMVLNG